MNCEKAVYSIRAALKVKRAMVPSNVVVISLVSFSKILPLYHSTLHFRSDCFKLINNSKDLFSITFTSVSSDISFVLIVTLDDLLTTSSPLYHVTFGSGLALQRHFMVMKVPDSFGMIRVVVDSVGATAAISAAIVAVSCRKVTNDG
uniref:Uncharacterized protein n=1 Tax=Glossina pallidipes TaxID=7398 RepID=A0A1A9Z1Y0_GLOPL